MKFSIILPTYSRASFLPKAIESVIAQTYQNWELIVIDDGSTDSTNELVESYTIRDNRIKYYFQQNQERSVARNNGIEKSIGSFICFLDSDDYYLNNHLQNFKELIESKYNEKAIYVCGVKVDNKELHPTEYNIDYINDVEFFFVNSIATSRACISRNAFKNNKFDKTIRIGEDRELFMRIANTYKVYYSQTCTYVEVNHRERSILEGNNKSSLEHLKTLKHIIKKHSDKLSSKKINIELSNAYFNIGYHYLLIKDRKKAFKYFFKSIFSKTKHPQTKFRINILLKIIFQIKIINIVEMIKE